MYLKKVQCTEKNQLNRKKLLDPKKVSFVENKFNVLKKSNKPKKLQYIEKKKKRSIH